MPSAQAATDLDAFDNGECGEPYRRSRPRRWAWSHDIPFLAFRPDIHSVFCTTNAIESINAQPRKIIKTRGHFPPDKAVSKIVWLALHNFTADWGRALKE